MHDPCRSQGDQDSDTRRRLGRLLGLPTKDGRITASGDSRRGRRAAAQSRIGRLLGRPTRMDGGLAHWLSQGTLSGRGSKRATDAEDAERSHSVKEVG